MKYCTKCLMPETKPDLTFDEKWVCNACNNFLNRKAINWDERKNEFITIMNKYSNENNYDCIIPVSWWKDSTYQVIKVMSLGYKPLCVTSTTCHLSQIWRNNIENIKRLWVDYIEFTINPNLRKKINKIWLFELWDISWPEHASIFTLPIKIAVSYKIPLIIWWENSQNEYGWPAGSTENNILDRRWLEEFWWLLWMRITDLIWVEWITKKDLLPFFYPSDEELKQVWVTWLFLWYYFPWDWYKNALISKWHWFETFNKTVEWSIVDYENLDNYQTWIHDYFKFLKFWFGRSTDIACTHLRRWRLNRDEAKTIVELNDWKFPWTYLWKPLNEILEPLDITIDEFIKVCDKFTNKKIFKTDINWNLIKDKKWNLIKLFPII